MASLYTVGRRLSLSFCPFDHLWLLIEGRAIISHGDELTLGIFCTLPSIIVHGRELDRSKTVGIYCYRAMLQEPVILFSAAITSLTYADAVRRDVLYVYGRWIHSHVSWCVYLSWHRRRHTTIREVSKEPAAVRRYEAQGLSCLLPPSQYLIVMDRHDTQALCNLNQHGRCQRLEPQN